MTTWTIQNDCPTSIYEGAEYVAESYSGEDTARLIAAAPDMQAALELFVKQWNACGPNSDFGRYFSNVRKAAVAALAKAGE